MLLPKDILLLVILCACWETGDTSCQIECEQSQIGLTEPTCYLRDDGTNTECSISVSSSDTAIRTLGSFDKLTIMLDLQTRVRELYIYNYIDNNKLKVNTFKFHTELTSLTLYYGNTRIHPVMFLLLPNLKYLALSSVYFVYFPYFAHTNRFLTYLYIYIFDISSPSPHILTRDHVSGLSQLKYLFLYPTQYINTTEQSFSGLTALTYLYTGYLNIPNPITTLSPLVRLKGLYIHYSRMTDISFLTQTPFLYRLTRLGFDHNLITQIPAGIFSNYANLAYLSLYNNSLIQLESEAFKRLSNLEILFLNSNPIQNLSLTAFKGLESLSSLSLQDTSLTSLSSRMFEYLPSLVDIWLYNVPLHCNCSLQWIPKVHHSFSLYLSNALCVSPSEHRNKLATDPSIYTECIQDLSYQCFNRSVSCPAGSYCQDTLDTYTCVCEQEGYTFIRNLNKCVSSGDINNGLQKLNTNTCATCANYATCPSCATYATCPSCTTSATCPSCTTSATCPSCTTSATCPSCPTVATSSVTRAQPCKCPTDRP